MPKATADDPDFGTRAGADRPENRFDPYSRLDLDFDGDSVNDQQIMTTWGGYLRHCRS